MKIPIFINLTRGAVPLVASSNHSSLFYAKNNFHFVDRFLIQSTSNEREAFKTLERLNEMNLCNTTSVTL